MPGGIPEVIEGIDLLEDDTSFEVEFFLPVIFRQRPQRDIVEGVFLPQHLFPTEIKTGSIMGIGADQLGEQSRVVDMAPVSGHCPVTIAELDGAQVKHIVTVITGKREAIILGEIVITACLKIGEMVGDLVGGKCPGCQVKIAASAGHHPGAVFARRTLQQKTGGEQSQRDVGAEFLAVTLLGDDVHHGTQAAPVFSSIRGTMQVGMFDRAGNKGGEDPPHMVGIVYFHPIQHDQIFGAGAAPYVEITGEVVAGQDTGDIKEGAQHIRFDQHRGHPHHGPVQPHLAGINLHFLQLLCFPLGGHYHLIQDHGGCFKLKVLIDFIILVDYKIEICRFVPLVAHLNPVQSRLESDYYIVTVKVGSGSAGLAQHVQIGPDQRFTTPQVDNISMNPYFGGSSLSEQDQRQQHKWNSKHLILLMMVPEMNQ